MCYEPFLADFRLNVIFRGGIGVTEPNPESRREDSQVRPVTAGIWAETAAAAGQHEHLVRWEGEG